MRTCYCITKRYVKGFGQQLQNKQVREWYLPTIFRHSVVQNVRHLWSEPYIYCLQTWSNIRKQNIWTRAQGTGGLLFQNFPSNFQPFSDNFCNFYHLIDIFAIKGIVWEGLITYIPLLTLLFRGLYLPQHDHNMMPLDLIISWEISEFLYPSNKYGCNSSFS